MTTRERIIEGTWTCTSCGRREIAARNVKCPSCNNPREQGGGESRFDFGARAETGRLQREAVSEAELLRRATIGPDWFCGFCGTSNAADAERCGHCSGPRTEKQGEAEVKSLDGPLPAEIVPEGAEPGAKKPRRWPFVLAGAALIVAGAGFWATRTHDEDAQLVEARWQRSVHKERFARVTRQGWRDELRLSRAVMPVDGQGEAPGVEDVRNCRREQRGTRQVQVGTQRVCHTRSRQEQCGTEEKCSVVDLGNGMAKETCTDVPKYCSVDYEECADEPRYEDQPVFADRCEYDTYVWRRVDTQVAQGTREAPRWPSMGVVAPVERLVREEEYSVRLRYDGTKEHTVTPESEGEFRRWTAADHPKLRVSNLGLVTEATPE